MSSGGSLGIYKRIVVNSHRHVISQHTCVAYMSTIKPKDYLRKPGHSIDPKMSGAKLLDILREEIKDVPYFIDTLTHTLQDHNSLVELA